MQSKSESSAPPSKRESSLRVLEAQKLRYEATKYLVGPANPSSFFAKQKREFIEKYVREGLIEFDKQVQQDKEEKMKEEDQLMFQMDL